MWIREDPLLQTSLGHLWSEWNHFRYLDVDMINSTHFICNMECFHLRQLRKLYIFVAIPKACSLLGAYLIGGLPFSRCARGKAAKSGMAGGT